MEVIEITENEKVLTTDFNDRKMYVERVAENYLNFYTGHKKEDYEVNFYVFSEDIINDFIERQEKIYKLLEQQDRKSSLNSFREKLMNLILYKKK